MSYREKIEKYKRHLLSEAERLQVEEDIEKVDAISEYLAEKLEEELDFGEKQTDADRENESVSETDSVELAEDDSSVKEAEDTRRNGRKNGRKKAKSEADEFEKYVQKAIRRSFAKMTAVVGAVLLAVVLFVQFGLSPIMDSLYYDPTVQEEFIYENGNISIVYQKMGMDLDIYTTLTKPLRTGNMVSAVSLGYGNYSITITPTVAYGAKGHRGVGGQIRKGKLELYDPNFLKTEYSNVFACYGFEPGEDYDVQMERHEKKYEAEGVEVQTWRYPSLEDGRQALEWLDEDKEYAAYVSFKRDLSFDEVNDLMIRIRGLMNGEPWLGVQVSDFNSFSSGFIGHLYRDYRQIRTPEAYNEKYPELSCWDTTPSGQPDFEKMDKKSEDEAVVTQHFISMLDYMDDQKEFLDVIEPQAATFGKFRGAARFIEENGLKYYGLVCIATKEDILHMMEQEEIIGIVPQEWN